MLLNLVVEIVMDGVVVNEWDLSSSDCKFDQPSPPCSLTPDDGFAISDVEPARDDDGGAGPRPQIGEITENCEAQ